MPAPRPFQIDVPRETLDTIRSKVEAYAWHEMPEVAAGADRWAYGADMQYVRAFADYWVQEYDWRHWEAKLNAWPHFMAEIDGQDIHFLHIRGSAKKRQALLLTHGWPGSVLEFLSVIQPLTQPGKDMEGIDLVIPSLPGYGWSGKPKTPTGPKRTAELWDRLMCETLGYDTYIAQGGDWGSVVTGWLGYHHGIDKGRGCKAIHLNMYGLRTDAPPETEEEKAWADTTRMTLEMEGAYLRLQMTKPQSLSYAMMDSPVGVAAWFLEKFNTWGDTRGPDGKEHIENAFSRDVLATNIMIYLVTRTFNTATWYYRGMFEEGGTSMAPGTRVEIPVGVANYPRELFTFPPRSMVEKGYNIVHWSDFAKGGHFAALEDSTGFVSEIRTFLKTVAG